MKVGARRVVKRTIKERWNAISPSTRKREEFARKFKECKEGWVGCYLYIEGVEICVIEENLIGAHVDIFSLLEL